MCVCVYFVHLSESFKILMYVHVFSKICHFNSELFFRRPERRKIRPKTSVKACSYFSLCYYCCSRREGGMYWRWYYS